MKKMTFALACASAFAVFADEMPNPVISSINFDAYTAGFTGLSNMKDDGTATTAAGDSFWLYDGGASGATDGSTVKAYDPAITGNANYLELSTEGGTLWRSINGLYSTSELGAAQPVPENGNIYVDTMVQFTPTEDGGAPDLTSDDKLAIWLNVTAGENGAPSATNLCVRALSYTDGELATSAPATFTLARVDGEPLVVDAGSWHRLTVEAIQNVFASVETGYLPAFTIKFDGIELCATATPFSVAKDTLVDPEGELLSDTMKALVSADRIFPSLQGMLGEEQVAGLSAVGFKGSGAIDSLQFTTEDPNPGHADVVPVTGVTLDQSSATLTVGGSLTLTATVAPDNATDKTVTWSVTEGDAVTVVDGVVMAAKVGTATVTAMAGDKTATCTVTVNPIAVTATVTLSATTAEWAADLQLPTPTVTGAPEGATSNGAWSGSIPAANPTESVTLTYTVTFTGNYSGTASATFTVTPQAKKYPKYISEANQEAYDAWVSKYSVEDRVDTDEALLDAFLLNVAPTDAEDEAGKFTITSITIDATGKVTVVAPAKNSKGDDFNGTVEVKGAAAVDAAKYELETTDPTAKFFKAFLSLPAAE